MKPKIGIVSKGYIKHAFVRVSETLKMEADFIFSDARLTVEQKLPAALMNCDVLLSSGYFTRVLYQITDIPIINVEPSLFDLLSAYDKALELHSNPVIILPFGTKLSQIEQLQNILSVTITFSYYENLEEIDDIIRRYRDNGYQCILGSGHVCEHALELGMSSIFVYPEETLRSFLQLAYDTALSIRKKSEASQQLQSMFNYSKQGILFTDAEGTICLCNDLAGKILKRKHNVLTGTPIWQFFPKIQLSAVFKEHEPVNYLICSFEGEQYIASIIPIIFKGELDNVMITIDSIHNVQKQEQHIRNTLAQKGFIAKHHFKDMVSYNSDFHMFIRSAKKFAKSDDCITILGETGVGKEVLAQSIHNYSVRSDKPFIAVNCSAISENLLESELFGYDEGAFTGARKGGKQGYFEMAHHGTIFLDEIGEISLPLQSKLLRVIQEHQLIHVGGSRVINFDVRIITATNRNLWNLVRSGGFREDLYYRLAVLELEIPPLRRRREDILPLFLNFVSKRDSMLAAELEKSEKKLEALLCLHTWPGNVRELENFTKMIVVTYHPSAPMDDFWKLLTQEISRRKERSAACQETYESPFHISPEYQQIQEAMAETGGNCTKSAELLGISRVTLWRKLKAYREQGLTE